MTMQPTPERLLALIRGERAAAEHFCNLRIDRALTDALGGDLKGASWAMEAAAHELYEAQEAVTVALLGLADEP